MVRRGPFFFFFLVVFILVIVVPIDRTTLHPKIDGVKMYYNRTVLNLFRTPVDPGSSVGTS